MEHQLKEKILLLLLPYWDPLIPPLGIACLKRYLQGHGYRVTTMDTNVEPTLRAFYDLYFNTLRKCLPAHKRGGIYNVGNEVLRHHMMAHLHYRDETQYIELVRLLAGNTFYEDIPGASVRELNRVLTDFYLHLEKVVLEALEKEQPSVLGLSVFCSTLPASLFTFRLAKEKYPAMRTVMGGGVFADQLAPGSVDLELLTAKASYIDHMIVGEGETLMLKLLRGELPQSRKLFTIQDNNNEVLDLSTVDIPDFSDLELEYYPFLAAFGSRSCPFQCKFCSETVTLGKFRKKNVRQLVNELKRLYQLHDRRLFLLGDSLLNPFISDLAHMFLEDECPLYWDGYLRADKPVCDIENTLLWRRGGFYRARLGLESGSRRVLELMGKRITPQQIRDALASLAAAGIKTSTMWVIGFPGETEEDFQQTLDLIEELKEDIYEAECNPFIYFPNGQVNSGTWKNHRKTLLYPEYTKDILLSQTWILGDENQREEMFARVNRFEHHCKKLGIHNPYSLYDIYNADERWKKLHENAVPSIMEIKDNAVDPRECRKVEKLCLIPQQHQDEGDFCF